MAVEIVFSSEMSRGLDPETSFLTSYLTRGFSPSIKLTSSERECHSRAEENFQFLIKEYDDLQFIYLFFPRCIDLHRLIVHHKTSNVHYKSK